ncbi:magnesium transporter MgtE [Pseudodesulfovibrio sp. zrk46]|nr:magnesium transporter MgtE [Pseudodesulfovibrio sp. zrk46]
MKKKAPEKRRKTMKWQRFGTNLKISRVLISLVFLALMKIAVFGLLSVDSVTLKVVEAVMPEAALPALAVAQDEAPTPIADKADSEANRAKEAEAAADVEAEKVRTEADLPEEWKALKRKEEELAIKERTLQEMEATIRAEAKKVEKLHTEMRQMLDEAKNVKDKRVKQLIGMISNTKAKKAAEILQTMDTDLAVKVLSGMQGRKSGEILSYVEAKKAAELSEKMTALQIPFMEQGQ